MSCNKWIMRPLMVICLLAIALTVSVGAISVAHAQGPLLDSLLVSATSPSNLTTDDLLCTYGLLGTATTSATAWYRNGSPLAVLYMPFEGGASNALLDMSGYGASASTTGTPVWSSTGGHDGGGAFHFDQDTDGLLVPDASALDVDYVTLAAWVYLDSLRDDARIISKEFGTTQPYSIYTMSIGQPGENLTSEDHLEMRIGLEGQDRIRQQSVSAIPTGAWTHIATSFDGTTIRIYINGVLDVSFPAFGVLRKNNEPVYIGQSGFYDRPPQGWIDDARVYDYALSPEQILALANQLPNTIKSAETTIGDLWHAQVTPFSATEVGSTYVSNTLLVAIDSVPPTITSTPVTDGYAGWLYTYNVDATGYPDPTYELLVRPVSMTIDSISGLIQWTPAAAGSAQVTVKASNTEGSDQQMFIIAVQDSLPIVRITPLGNSITYDNHSGDIRPAEERISYRYPLWQLLTNAGYEFDLVGSVSAGGTYFPDPENDGYPGWTDTQIADSVYVFLQRNPTDICLLHIGTNGLNSSPDDVEDILNEIDRFEVDAGVDIWVVLARIINRSSYSSLTTTFNNNVEAMALLRTTDKIVIVDMEDGAGIDYRLQPLGDMWDNLHPNDDGYAKMADVWFAALQGLMPTPSPPVCTSGMTHYWKFDQASSSPYEDLYGSNHAQATNEPALTAGIVAGAQEFDGINDEVVVPDDGTFDWGTDDSFSVEFWMKKDTPCAGPAISNNDVIVGRDDGSSSLHWWVGVVCAYSPQGVACFQLRDKNGNGDAIYGSTVITDGTWHHVVAVRDGGANMNRIYVDGIKEDSLLHDYTADFGGVVGMNIGYLSLPDYYHYEGAIDEIATYNRALSDGDILAHYLSGLQGVGYCADVPIAAAPMITSTPDTDGTVLQMYSYDVNASGYPLPTYELITYPAGMSIDSLTGVIDWTPAATGSVQVTVEAANSEGFDTQNFTIHVTEAPVCPSGMVSYWRLDETSGSTYDDFYDAHDGQGSGFAPTPSVDGVVGGSQDFNGSNQRITIADDPAFDFAASSSFTVELWTRFTNVSGQNKVMIGRDQGGGNPHWWIGAWASTGVPTFYLLDANGNGGGVFGPSGVNDDNWHHLVAIRDDSVNRNRLYVDGVKVDSLTYNYGAGFGAATTIGIGYMAYNSIPNYFYDGLLDEIAIYDRALSDPEVLEHYTDGLIGKHYCNVDSIAPSIVSIPSTNVRTGEFYSYDVEASGTPEPAYNLTVFPSGMTIDPVSGLIEWTPAVAGSAQVTVEALNAVGSDYQSFTILVSDPPVCPPGMISYWKLDETTGATYTDFNDGNNGTASAAAPTPTTGLIGGAQDFDGSSNYITVADDPSLDWAFDASFTAEVWVKFTNVSGSNRVMIGRDDGGGGKPHWWLGAQSLTGYALFNLLDTNGAGPFTIGSTSLNDDQWHHLAAIRDDGANMNRLYVDGQKVDSAFFDYTAGFEAATTLGIGYMAYNANPSYFYDGAMDEVTLFSRALSDTEVEKHYAAGLAGKAHCDQYTLAVNTSGGGVVSKLPDLSSFAYGDTVVVTALPDPGWAFDVWSGGLTGSENPDTVVMVNDTSVTATFTQDQYVLTTNVVGDGNVTRAPDQAAYAHGDTVIVTAVPDSAWAFDVWTGGLTGSENPDTVVMVNDTSVTATFTQDQHTLTTNVVGNGQVTKSPDQAAYAYGDTVIVTAVPDSAWAFDDWSGDLTGSENPDTCVIDSSETITATFSEIPTGIRNTPALTRLTVTQNAPNPFSNRTVIWYGLPAPGDVEIEVYDVLGRRVLRTGIAHRAEGWHPFQFDALGTGGQRLPAGVYFYRVKALGDIRTKKMVILR